MRTTARGPFLVAATVVVALCSGWPLAARETPTEVDLDAVEPAVRQALQRAREAVRLLVESRDPDPRALAEAWGTLGAFYHAHGLSAGAAQAYREAMGLDAGEARWPYLLSRLHAADGDAAAALASLRAAIDREPGWAFLGVRQGDLLLDRGDLDGAVESYEKALAQRPDSAAAHAGLGRVALARGRHEEAQRELEAALALQPQATALHYPLAQALQRRGEAAAATRHLEQRGETPVRVDDPLEQQLADIRATSAARVAEELALRPDLDAENLRGFLVSQLAASADAAAYFAERAASDELAAEQRARLFFVHALLLEIGEADAAEVDAVLERALTLDPDLAAARRERLATAQRGARWAVVEKVAGELLQADPADAEARLARAVARLASSDRAGVAADLEILTDSPPVDAAAALRLANLLSIAGRHQPSLELFDRLLSSERAADGPWRRQLRVQRAQATLRAGDVDAALADLEELEAGGPLPDLAAGVAGALATRGEYRRAAILYRQIYAARPSESIVLSLATALFLDGDDAAAASALDDAIAVYPDSRSLRHLQARLLAISPNAEVRDPNAALTIVDRLLSEGTSSSLYYSKALALAGSGRAADAADLLEGLAQSAERSGAPTMAQRFSTDADDVRQTGRCCATADRAELLPPIEANTGAGG